MANNCCDDVEILDGCVVEITVSEPGTTEVITEGPQGPPGATSTDCNCTFDDVAPCESPEDGDIIQYQAENGGWVCTPLGDLSGIAINPCSPSDPNYHVIPGLHCQNTFDAGPQAVVLFSNTNHNTPAVILSTDYHNGANLLILTRGNALSTTTTTLVDVMQTTTDGNGLFWRATGDTLGPVDLAIRNTAGQNGLEVKTSGFEVAEILLSTDTISEHIRLENRAGFVHATQPEIQIGGTNSPITNGDHPWLVAGSGVAQIQGDAYATDCRLQFANNTSNSGHDFEQAKVSAGWKAGHDTSTDRKGTVSLCVADNLGWQCGLEVSASNTDGGTADTSVAGNLTVGGTITGDGSGLTNLPAGGLPNDATFDTLTVNDSFLSLGLADFDTLSANQIDATVITGTGAGITNLDAGNISTGTLPIVRGGTGQTTASTAINALVPTQTSNANKFLQTDGSAVSWASGNSGTVTSVAASVPAFLSVSGSPITTSGTLAVSLSGTALPVANGGTGQTTANTAFNALVPTQTSNASKFLQTDGTNTSWVAGNSGTVSSVAITLPSILSVSGSPITTSGTLAVSLANQTANKVFSVGSITTTPSFRTLTTDDVPTLSALGGAPTTRTITAGTGLTGGGDLSADRTISLSSPVAIANGGTNATSAATAANNLLPSQTSNANKFLQTDGSGTLGWASVSGGSVSGGVIQSGAVASLPSNSADGIVYMPTDGDYLYRDNGSTWSTWGNLRKCKRPVTTDFTWVNQGTATISNATGPLVMTATVPASGNHRMIHQTCPATPWTLTTWLQYTYPLDGGTTWFGMYFLQNSSGKFHAFDNLWNGSGNFFRSSKYDSFSAFSANYQFFQYGPANAGTLVKDIWMRLIDDGTNRKLQYSFDGRNFVQYDSRTRTDYITADRAGIFAAVGATCYLTCLHYEFT